MAILDTALSEATRVGLGGLSIGGLARLLDMSKSGLFAHFDSKENLQLQVLQNARDRAASGNSAIGRAFANISGADPAGVEHRQANPAGDARRARPEIARAAGGSIRARDPPPRKGTANTGASSALAGARA